MNERFHSDNMSGYDKVDNASTSHSAYNALSKGLSDGIGGKGTEYYATVNDEPEYTADSAPVDVEVTDYQQVIFDDGSMMDVAVVDADGLEIGVIDMDMDGEADMLVADLNDDGVVGFNEMQVISGMGVDMQQFADAVDPLGTSPLASNDMGGNMPDYIDDANVDGFMA